VATLSVIRRWALREQMSIREISRRTGLARNTVKKYLRAGDEEPRYAKRASTSKLDPYADKLSTWLLIEATKSRKQRRTLLQLHTLLCSHKRVGQHSMEISGQRSVELNSPSPRRHFSLLQSPQRRAREDSAAATPPLDANAPRSCPAKYAEPERWSVAAPAWRSIGRRAALDRVFAELDALAGGKPAHPAYCLALAQVGRGSADPCLARGDAAWPEVVLADPGDAGRRAAMGKTLAAPALDRASGSGHAPSLGVLDWRIGSAALAAAAFCERVARHKFGAAQPGLGGARRARAGRVRSTWRRRPGLCASHEPSLAGCGARRPDVAAFHRGETCAGLKRRRNAKEMPGCPDPPVKSPLASAGC